MDRELSKKLYREQQASGNGYGPLATDCAIDYSDKPRIPEFAYFQDINNPVAERIYKDDFPRKISPGTKVWRIIVEPTKERPLLDLDKRISWLGDKQACKNLDTRWCGELWQPQPLVPPAAP